MEKLEKPKSATLRDMGNKLPKILEPYYEETSKAPKANNFNKNILSEMGKIIDRNQKILSDHKKNEGINNR